jgi:UDP-glucose 4-epimerase
MRTLVTGGAGFIGSALVDRLLAEGHSVDVIDDLSSGSLANLSQARSLGGSLTFQKMDVRIPELIEYVARRRPEVIFHLAAQTSVTDSVVRPIFDADSNIIGSLRVFEAALGATCKKVIVAASGGSLYGDGTDETLPFDEESPQVPSSPYALSKSVMCQYLKLYNELFGLEFTVLALANVYGPRQRFSGEGGVVSIFAHALASGQAPTIYGDGRQSRDFVFVDDVVDAFVRAGTRGNGKLLNISTAVEISVRDLYLEVSKIVNVKIKPTRSPKRAGELRRSSLSYTAAERELGWRPWTSLHEGVEATLAWLRTQ